MKESLRYFLHKYGKIQDKILLIYRPTETSGWSNRCFYLGDDYDPQLEYNHRWILKNEVVIEFDSKDTAENRKNALTVYQRLFDDGHSCLVAGSGNKSTHVHCFIDVGEARNVPQLKRDFMRYYCKDLPLPDLQLAGDNHPIRAEFGKHERTGNVKALVKLDKSYPRVTKVRKEIWEEYTNSMATNTKRAMTNAVSDITALEGFKHILASDQFRANEDGRSRALFMLIYVLKQKDDYKQNKESLAEFLASWYRYSGGNKLSETDIRRRVFQAYEPGATQYTPGKRYLNELLEAVGKQNLIDK